MAIDSKNGKDGGSKPAKPTYRKSGSGRASAAAGKDSIGSDKPVEEPKRALNTEESKAKEADSSAEACKEKSRSGSGLSDSSNHSAPSAFRKDSKDAGVSSEEHEKDEKPAEKQSGAKHAKVPRIEKRKRPVGIIVGALAAAALVACGVAFALSGNNGTAQQQDNTVLDTFDIQYNDAGEVVNPVDWDEWIGRNPDVYAWLRVDDTNVDYPILQHPVVDDYYLMRNIDGEPEVNGTLYTQIGYNSKDFEEDPVTIIYGHTFEQADTMFTTLHNFEDSEFFETHPTFAIFTPTERLEYEVVSAFEYDNSHILMTNDMDDPQVRADFFQMVQNPNSINKNVRQMEKALDPDEDNLLILSTCTKPANDSQRYLVVAVLKSVESTEKVELSEDDGVLESHTLTPEEVAALAAEEG